MRKTKKLLSSFLIVAMLSSLMLSGCNSGGTDKIEVELVQYKPEAVAAFEKIEEGFNNTHDNIHLTIQSPNEAMTILKTRFIREDYPDIVGIGGDINYSNFLDADMFMDISDFEGVSDIKQAYMDIEDELEFIPTDGVYALPYVANAAGILYNKDMFEKNGWKIPQTWTEFTELCETIKTSGVQPLYFGYKDTWTCLAPWNALAVGLSPSDTCAQVNAGKTTFSKRDRMRYHFMMQLFGLRLDKRQFKKDFGCSVEMGLPVEMAFMKASGAFATDNADELTLTPKGRYLLVVMMRQFFIGVNNLRDQARAALPGEEKELLFGSGCAECK